MNFEVVTSELCMNDQNGKIFFRNFYYMVNATKFGQAETLAENHLEKHDKQGNVKEIKESDVTEVDKKEHDFFYKIKVTVTEEDPDTGKLKPVRYYHLISANIPEDAIAIARQRFSPTYGNDYSVDTTSKTPFLDIINY